MAPSASDTPSSVLQQIQANQTRLNNLQTETSQATTGLGTLQTSITDISNKIDTYDIALQSLADTQTAQGDLIQKLNDKYTSMENHILRLCKHLEVPLQDSPITQDGRDVEMQDNTNSPSKQPMTQQPLTQQLPSKPPQGGPGGKSS